ncbi:hypothetical protein O3M35_008255 [Rhynocoris fuscipes]|uniref:Spaetzle domain-containing protein n=1 Tax=Rhynocoris fuscipes TaxID=488301 RepID=A0AAW1DD46_9HEMI
MGYFPQILGLLVLVCSVNLLPTQETGIKISSSYTMKTRQGRRSEIDARPPTGTWSDTRKCNQSSAKGSEITFPDRFVPPFGKKAPECAKGSTFCETVEDYPSTYLENALQDAGNQFRIMFGDDLLGDSSISHRIDIKDEFTLCPSIENVVYPQIAKNKENEWLFIVNQGQYRQGVRVETCKSPDNSESCAFTEAFPLGYKTTCRQKYIYRRLIALNADGKTITDTFQLPSCCACIVTNDGLGLEGRSRNAQIKAATNITKPV